MKPYAKIKPSEIKRQKLMNGMKETIIEGEEQYLLDVNNVLLLGIQVVTTKEEGINAIENLQFAKKIVGEMGEEAIKYLVILDSNDTTDLTHSVILSNDVTEQLCSMTKLLYLASEKAIDKLDK